MVYATCTYPKPGYEGSRSRDYQYELAVVNLNRTAAPPQRLTVNGAFDYYPAWSPDGQRIGSLRGRHNATGADETAGALHIMGRDGADARLIRFGESMLGAPSWSPDGRWLAFVTDEDDAGLGLYILNSDRTVRRRLTDTVSAPSWSPNGQRLAIARRDGAALALYTVTLTADDAVERRIAPLPDDWPEWIPTVAWSPAGKHILYGYGDVVRVVTLDGTPGTAAFAGVGAAWSPDGSRIAVVGGGNIAVYSIAPDGTDPRPLVELRGGGLVAAQAEHGDAAAGIAACATGVVVRDPEQHPDLVRDCETLVGLRQALLGGVVLNWNMETPIEQWTGVDVSGTPRRVVGLGLGGLRIPGTLPSALGELTSLRGLALWGNRFTGPIPPELGRLANLKDLHLDGNQLTGPIPLELGRLANLKDLHLDGNQLTGPIPPELGRLPTLHNVRLSANRLTGPIPPELGQAPHLWTLSLGHNQLAGPIPPELGQLAELGLLDLTDNQLTGPIPPELGQLARLGELYLAGNQLTGPIPPELSQLTKLTHLELSANQLTGPISLELLQLTKLTHLELSANQLTGPIPPELGQLANLWRLGLADNQLTGPIPPELGQLANLRELYLAGNQLTGPIPPELGQLTRLTHLYLQENQLTGPIPGILGSTGIRGAVLLGGNRLTGCVPPAATPFQREHSDLERLGLPDCEPAR